MSRWEILAYISNRDQKIRICMPWRPSCFGIIELGDVLVVGRDRDGNRVKIRFSNPHETYKVAYWLYNKLVDYMIEWLELEEYYTEYKGFREFINNIEGR